MTELTLPERAYLVAMDGQKGRLPLQVNGSQFMCLAAVTQLILTGRLRFGESRPLTGRGLVADPTLPPPADELGRMIYDDVVDKPERHLSQLAHKGDWILDPKRRAVQLVRNDLVRAGLLNHDGSATSDERAAFVRRMSSDPSEQDVAVFAVIRAVKLERWIFDSDEIKEMERVLEGSSLLGLADELRRSYLWSIAS